MNSDKINIVKQISLLFFFILFSSCTHYFITVKDLQAALGKVTDSTAVYSFEIHGTGPVSLIHSATLGRKFHNGISEINCTTDKGEAGTFLVNNRTKLKITYTRGYRATFFFDTMYLKNDSSIYGRVSRNDNSYIRILPKEIDKIEIISWP